MMEFLRTFPQAAPFIGDLYVKAPETGRLARDRRPSEEDAAAATARAEGGRSPAAADPAQIMQAKASGRNCRRPGRSSKGPRPMR